MGNESIKLLLPYLLFEIVQEGKPLFVRDRRESIVWIFTLQVNDQLGEFVILSKFSY